MRAASLPFSSRAAGPFSEGSAKAAADPFSGDSAKAAAASSAPPSRLLAFIAPKKAGGPQRPAKQVWAIHLNTVFPAAAAWSDIPAHFTPERPLFSFLLRMAFLRPAPFFFPFFIPFIRFFFSIA